MKIKSALIILNGKEFNKKEFLSALSKDDFILAVDGGIRHLEGLDIPPVIHIGDMDSSPPETTVHVKDTIIFPEDKDISDFELALEYAFNKNIKNISVFAGTGGRTDHFLSNYESAVRCAQKGMKIIFIGKTEVIYFIAEPETFKFPKNSAVSIFSGTERAENVTLNGFRYKAEQIDLYRNTPVGLSNVANSAEQNIKFDTGVLVVIHNTKKV